MAQLNNEKECRQCGKMYLRHKKFTIKRWENSKFCSRTCSGESASKRNRTKRPTLFEKFSTKFIRGVGCWEWTGTIEGYGYGVIDHNWKRYRAHVLALEFDGRPVPKGMNACHHCDNRRCVRPSHLYVGTTKQNSRDAVERGRVAAGSRHPNSKLSESLVLKMRLENGNYSQIAKKYGVSRPTAAKAIKGISWRHVK